MASKANPMVVPLPTRATSWPLSRPRATPAIADPATGTGIDCRAAPVMASNRTSAPATGSNPKICGLPNGTERGEA